MVIIVSVGTTWNSPLEHWDLNSLKEMTMIHVILMKKDVHGLSN